MGDQVVLQLTRDSTFSSVTAAGTQLARGPCILYSTAYGLLEKEVGTGVRSKGTAESCFSRVSGDRDVDTVLMAGQAIV